jgi:hypothetical protein
MASGRTDCLNLLKSPGHFAPNVLPLFQDLRASAGIFAALKLDVAKTPLNLTKIVLAEHLTLAFAYLQTYSICFAQLL